MTAPNSRTVRVFLSSTFRDFAGERDLLVKKIFPELRRRCRERQVELVDVDLRWGITEEEAQQGKVLPICLAEIDRSRPFFMGFLGERYGWVPEAGQYDLSLLLEQPWLEEKKHLGNKSVTELEILHGVLDNPAMEKRAFFYFRDPAWSEAQGGDYLCEGPAEQARLAELKERIRQSGFPVVENYASPEELAERVREDLWQLIDEAYPESEVPDALTRERMTHEGYGASRLGLYFGGEPYFAAIDAAVTADPRRPILVTGESGGGKSALLANWASRFARQNPNAILLTHYLAVGADAAQPVTLVIRILREISRFTGEELTLEGDPRKALHLLGHWLAKAGAFALDQGGAFVLVLDGLDKMDAPADLGWWPAELPEGVAMVASCLPGAIRDAVTQRMHWETISVSPLGRSECARFIKEHLEKYRKTLLPVFTERILDHPLSGNPLFLRTLLEELRVFGVHEELGERIDYYLASLTIDDLFERVLERVESDNSAESVRAFLEILWAAKESFAEDELLAVSGLPPAAWAPIHIALDESLIGHGGRVAFSHDYLRKAVQDRYLPTEETRQRVRERLAAFCAESMREGRKNLSPYVRRHAVVHFLEAGDWDGATAALADLEFIEARAVAQELAAMLGDYARAERLLPEGAEERNLADERQAELDRYARELVEYAAAWSRIREGSEESEPRLPQPVESARLWTSEEIAAERKRMTETPHRIDKVKAFRVFVATNAAPLQSHSSLEGFVANLARNDASAGPVHEEGKRRLEPLTCIKLLKQFAIGETSVTSSNFLSILDGHESPIYSVAISINGMSVCSASWDKTIRIWSAMTGACTKVLRGHEGPVRGVALTPDGSMILSGGDDKTIRIWSAITGECTKVLRGHNNAVLSLAVIANGKWVASGSWDKTIRLWDGEKWLAIEKSNTRSHAVSSLAICVNEASIIVSAGSHQDKLIGVLDVEPDAFLYTLEGHEKGVSSLISSAKGDCILSGSDDNTIRRWDLKTKKCTGIFEGHKKAVLDIAESPDGVSIVSCSRDGSIRIWDTYTKKCLNVLETSGKSITSMAHHPQKKKVYASGYDEKLQIWNYGSGDIFQVKHRHYNNRYKQNHACLAITPNGDNILSGGEDGIIRIWNAETLELIKEITAHENAQKYANWIDTILVFPDGSGFLSMAVDNTVRFWAIDADHCNALFFLRGIVSITFNMSKKVLIAGFGDGRLEFFEVPGFVFAPIITTSRKNLNIETQSTTKKSDKSTVTARPPCCGQVISIPNIIAERIELWSLNGGDGGFTDPALLLNCPSCEARLRINPFFIETKTNN